MMKAVTFQKYGSPDELKIENMAMPTPKEHQVLLKVQATAVNDYDYSLVTGRPFIYRLMFGFFKPKNKIPGIEMAGIIAALGAKANRFKVGDKVYSDISDHGVGTFAEYMCIHEDALTLMPPKMTFVQAAATPHAAMLALQGLVEVGKIKTRQKVLVNGAGGGVGVFALQIAKQFEAEVSGVDSRPKLATMQALGFDHVIDYKKEDFTKSKKLYDLILDTKTKRSTFSYLRALGPKGKYITVGGSLIRLLQLLLCKVFISLFTSKTVHIVALKPNKNLAYIQKLFAAKKIDYVIEGPYKLAEVAEAVKLFGSANHKGKVVIAMGDEAGLN